MREQNNSRIVSALTFTGLLGGFILGIAINRWGSPGLVKLAMVVEPVGVVWTNALRMTIIPLIVSMLVIGIASIRDQRLMGRLGGLSIITFIGLLFLGAAYSVTTTRSIMKQFPINPGSVAAMRATPSIDPKPYLQESKPGGLTDTITGLVPPNPFKSAADGALLPLVVFTVFFSMALSRVDEDRRRLMLNFFHALSDVSMTMVRWVMVLMPLGVFALVLPLAARMGIAIIGVLGYYTLLVCVILAGFFLLLYPLGILAGRIPARQFAAALAPAQIIAVSSRSSLASLPALIEGAHRHLPYPQAASTFVLTLAASTFKVNRTVSSTTTLLFFIQVYGLNLDVAAIAVFILTVIAQSFTTPGIPGGAPMPTLPLYLALGVPIEGYLLLQATDALIDVVKTAVNVTGNMAALTIVSRIAGAENPAISLQSDQI